MSQSVWLLYQPRCSSHPPCKKPDIVFLLTHIGGLRVESAVTTPWETFRTEKSGEASKKQIPCILAIRGFCDPKLYNGSHWPGFWEPRNVLFCSTRRQGVLKNLAQLAVWVQWNITLVLVMS